MPGKASRPRNKDYFKRTKRIRAEPLFPSPRPAPPRRVFPRGRRIIRASAFARKCNPAIASNRGTADRVIYDDAPRVIDIHRTFNLNGLPEQYARDLLICPRDIAGTACLFALFGKLFRTTTGSASQKRRDSLPINWVNLSRRPPSVRSPSPSLALHRIIPRSTSARFCLSRISLGLLTTHIIPLLRLRRKNSFQLLPRPLSLVSLKCLILMHYLSLPLLSSSFSTLFFVFLVFFFCIFTL